MDGVILFVYRYCEANGMIMDKVHNIQATTLGKSRSFRKAYSHNRSCVFCIMY
jgi:putative SOS response-associated peptidase YedK